MIIKSIKGFTLWIISVMLALIGLIMFAIGIGAAFDNAGNWADDVAFMGILLLSAAALFNFSAFILGIHEYCKNKKFKIWLIFCAAMILITIYMVNMALHL